MATLVDYPLLTADAFLEIDFGEHKAELDNGVIRMMAGGTARHATVQVNLIAALRQRLRGTGCRPFSSDMAVRTHQWSVRYPDISVFCDRSGTDDDAATAFSDPRILFEILSNGTARTDLRVKLPEYKALASVQAVVFIDVGAQTLLVHRRIGASAWDERLYEAPAGLDLPALGLTIPHDEIFARD